MQRLVMPLDVLSLGAGVQSSTLALMAARGEVTPMPCAGVFADVKAEPKAVIDWLDWLEKQLPFPIYRVTHKEGLLAAIENGAKRGVITGSPPMFTAAKDGTASMVTRACTRDFKIDVIAKEVRRIMGLKKGERSAGRFATLWIGISTDEITRMKMARQKHLKHRWPLIEKRMSRWDCLRWMKLNGYPEPPKSSCTFCPYHDDDLWQKIKTTDEAAWQQAIYVDNLIRTGARKTGNPMFLHRSMKPLAEVDFEKEKGQGELAGISMADECDGMCGV